MKVLLGIILGALLTVGAAYLYDSHTAAAAMNAPAATARPADGMNISGTAGGR